MHNKIYITGIINGFVTSVMLISSLFIIIYSEKSTIPMLKIVSIVIPFLTLIFYRDCDYLSLLYKKLFCGIFLLIDLFLITAIIGGSKYFSELYNEFNNMPTEEIFHNFGLYMSKEYCLAVIFGKTVDNENVFTYIIDFAVWLLVYMTTSVTSYIMVHIRNRRIARKSKKKYDKMSKIK